MPPRSKVDLLPQPVREELNRRLLNGGFGGYEKLEAWLLEQGFEIGKSSLHRYGTQFESRLENLKLATEQARAIVDASPDDEGAVNEALLRLTQERLFGLLLEAGEELTPKGLGAVTRAVADITRASVSQKKFAEEARSKLQKLEKDAEAGSKKLDSETLRYVREQLYGI